MKNVTYATKKDVEEIVNKTVKNAVTDLSNVISEFAGHVDARFTAVDVRFDKVDEKFKEVDARFDKVDEKFEEVDARFDKVDEKFEGVYSKFDRVDARFDALDTDIAGLRSDIRGVMNHLDKIEKDLTITEDERAVVSMQLTRIHSWVEKAAANIGAEFAK